MHDSSMDYTGRTQMSGGGGAVRAPTDVSDSIARGLP